MKCRRGKSPKRRLRRMKRDDFEEVPRLSDASAAESRLARRWPDMGPALQGTGEFSVAVCRGRRPRRPASTPAGSGGAEPAPLQRCIEGFPMTGGGAHGPRRRPFGQCVYYVPKHFVYYVGCTQSPRPYRPSQSPSVTALPEGEPRLDKTALPVGRAVLLYAFLYTFHTAAVSGDGSLAGSSWQKGYSSIRGRRIYRRKSLQKAAYSYPVQMRSSITTPMGIIFLVRSPDM